MKIIPLFEGSYSVDNSKKFIPFNPEIDDPKTRPGSLFIYVQPFLVDTGNHLILCDTGLGLKSTNGTPILQQNILYAGYDPKDVTLVLLSHLHSDHAGGMALENNGRLEISFPNAKYVVQKGEWETAYRKESKSNRKELFDVAQRSGNIHLVEGDGQLTTNIRYELTGGHCEYHQIFIISEEKDTCFFGGDILPEPEQLLRKFKAKYDFDGAKAMQLREEYGKLAAKESWSCLFYHAKQNPIAKIAYEDNTFRILSS